jgi:hypothetical protein
MKFLTLIVLVGSIVIGTNAESCSYYDRSVASFPFKPFCS